jgi:hypothetical protein
VIGYGLGALKTGHTVAFDAIEPMIDGDRGLDVFEMAMYAVLLVKDGRMLDVFEATGAKVLELGSATMLVPVGSVLDVFEALVSGMMLVLVDNVLDVFAAAEEKLIELAGTTILVLADRLLDVFEAV